jgi:hypothetical protein
MGQHDDAAKMKGVDREECSLAESLMPQVQQELSPHGIEVCPAFPSFSFSIIYIEMTFFSRMIMSPQTRSRYIPGELHV